MSFNRAVSGKSTAYYCSQCDKSYANDNSLEIHLRTSRKHVGNFLTCKSCSRNFPNISSLSQHIESGNCSSGMNRSSLNQMFINHVAGAGDRGQGLLVGGSEPGTRKVLTGGGEPRAAMKDSKLSSMWKGVVFVLLLVFATKFLLS